jgi:hypothetical protein
MRNTQSQKRTGGRRRRTKVERDVIVEEYWKSGRTQRVFALEAGISVSALQRWLEERRRREGGEPGEASRGTGSAGVSLLEVGLIGSGGGDAGPKAAEGESYEIIVRSGARLRVPVGFRDESVRRLLRLLEEES